MSSSLADAILTRLCEVTGQPVSGQDLARDLGVTRAAIWKAVSVLRGEGYAIDSLPARGYRLADLPGGVRPGELALALRGRRLGRPMRHFEVTGSTNREAEAWASEGAPEGALVIADHQRSGRGRMHRHWHDEAGRSLLFSLVLRPSVPAAAAPSLTFAAAVALADTLAEWLPEEQIAIKWPNDVLIAGRKTAGILLEMRAEGQRVEHVIMGVGVNVGGSAARFPEDIRLTGTTLADQTSQAPHRATVLARFLERFEVLYEAFQEQGSSCLIPLWNRWFRMSGQKIRVITPAGPVEGTALGLGESGSLRIDTGGQTPREIYAGDVEWCSTREELQP